MKRLALALMMIGQAVLWGAAPAAAGGLREAKTLVCRVDEAKAFHAQGAVKDFNPESVGLAKKFIIDFARGLVRPTLDSYVQRRSSIRQMVHVEDKLILLGAEDGVEGVDDGVGWAAAISEDTGRITISAAGKGVGYVVFGTCKP